jgi:hypothetical protein
MVFNAIFNYISVIWWLSCFIGVYWENHRPAASLTNFIHNVSRNKGCQVVAILHMTITTFIRVVYLICVTKLDDSFFLGEGGWSKKKKKIYELMKFLIQTQPPYNLYQKFIWDTKNNENEKVPFDCRLDNHILLNFAGFNPSELGMIPWNP